MNALNKKECGGKACTPADFMVWWFSFTGKVFGWFCFDLCIHLSLAPIGANQRKWSRMIRDDPGVFELALVAKLPYIGGKVALHWWQSCFTLVAKSPCIVGLICLSLNNKGESKIQEIALDTGRICCDQIWPWSLWVCIGDKVALHWWQSSLETAK